MTRLALISAFVVLLPACGPLDYPSNGGYDSGYGYGDPYEYRRDDYRTHRLERENRHLEHELDRRREEDAREDIERRQLQQQLAEEQRRHAEAEAQQRAEQDRQGKALHDEIIRRHQQERREKREEEKKKKK